MSQQVKIEKTGLLPSLREQGAGSRHHEDQTLKKEETELSLFFSYFETLLRTLQIFVVFCTYNTPTIITWSGPWRYVILCMNLYFSSLCMMMGRMTERKRRKKGQGRKGINWRSQCNIYILIPGAAMVTREMTTWEMPFTAAFYRGNTRRVHVHLSQKVTENVLY